MRLDRSGDPIDKWGGAGCSGRGLLDEMRGVDIACSLFPSAHWLIALHHHTSEYPRPAQHLSERLGTALINGTWFLRRLQQIAPVAVVMHGHRHIDWIGECGGLRIVSAPSPVMNTTDDSTTYFYIHTLARTSSHPLLDLLPPERIDIPGSRLQDIDRSPAALAVGIREHIGHPAAFRILLADGQDRDYDRHPDKGPGDAPEKAPQENREQHQKRGER